MSSPQSPAKASNARTAWQFIAGWLPWVALLLVTGLLTFLVFHFILMPAYDDPDSRLYTSRLGYVAMKRRSNEPLQVMTCTPQTRTITENFVGEGLVRSTPILVPIIPASRVMEVYVSDGDFVKAGQPLAKLDTCHAELRVEAARAVHEIAEAELERTKIGSNYLMEKERPEKDAIRLRAVQEKIEVQAELTEMHEKLAANRDISRADLLKLKLRNIDTLAELRQQKFRSNSL